MRGLGALPLKRHANAVSLRAEDMRGLGALPLKRHANAVSLRAENMRGLGALPLKRHANVASAPTAAFLSAAPTAYPIPAWGNAPGNRSKKRRRAEGPVHHASRSYELEQ
jgi:hypothetical protein